MTILYFILQLLSQTAQAHALGRVGHAQEVADAILCVTSDAASFITGAEIPVDGGMMGKNSFNCKILQNVIF